MDGKRTVTLTGRPPVNIVEADWPIVAASNWRAGGSEWYLTVREHGDERLIVYAAYRRSLPGTDRPFRLQHGMTLEPTASWPEVADAVRSLCEHMASCPHGKKDDESRWKWLGDKCISRLPPEELE